MFSRNSTYSANFEIKKAIIEEIMFDINDNDSVVKNLMLPLLLYFSEITSSVYSIQFRVKSRHNSKIYFDNIIEQ